MGPPQGQRSPRVGHKCIVIRSSRTRSSKSVLGGATLVSRASCFFFSLITLDTDPGRSLSLELGDLFFLELSHFLRSMS